MDERLIRPTSVLEQRVAGAFATMAAPGCLLDEDGAHLFTNDAYLQLLGYSAEELAELPFDRLLADPREETRAMREGRPGAWRDAGDRVLEVCLRRKDDTVLAARMTIRSQPLDAGSRCFVCTLTDITTYRQAARTLEQTLLEQRAIFDNASVGILFTRQRVVHSCNARLAEMFGYATEEVVGMPSRTFFESEQAYERLRKDGDLRLSAGTPYQTEIQMKRKDGSLFWCRLIAKAVDPRRTGQGTIWIIEDVTEAHRGREILHSTLLELQAIMNNASVAILFTRARHIVRYNPRFAEMFGFEGNEGVGKHAVCLYPTPEVYVEMGKIATPLLNKSKSFQTEVPMRRKDGTEFWAQLIGYALNPLDYAQGTIWIIEDRTEHKQAEESLRKALAEQQLIFDHATAGIAFLKDRAILRCNRKFEEIYGWAPNQLEQISTRVLFLSDADYEEIGARAYAAIARGETFAEEHRAARNGGKAFWVRATGKAVNPERISDGTIWIMEDVTLRREAEQALRNTTTLLQAIVDSANYSIISTNPEGFIVTFNAAAERMLGYRAEELIGECTPVIFHDLHELEQRSDELSRGLARRVEPGFGVLSARAALGLTDEREWTYVRRDGSTFPVLLSVTAIHDPGGAISGFLCIASDITERRQAQQQILRARDELEQRVAERTAELAAANARLTAEIEERRQIEEQVRHMAHHDALTGLPNRNLLRDRMEQAVAIAQRRGSHVVVMFLDLDRFKTINDSLGHAVGDQLLQEVSERLGRSVRASDTVARLGGDEFVVILPDVEHSSEAARVAEKISATLTPAYSIAGHELHITTSIGICVFPQDGDSAEALMKNADTAMYHAKSCGRNNYQFFTPEMNTAAARHFELESALRRACQRGEMRLHYQPLIDLRSGEVSSIEALLRWQHPNLGLLEPAHFLDIAEESGLIVAIGDWVVRQACEHAGLWRQRGFPSVPVAVNLSARQFREPGLVRMVARVLEETGQDPKLLEIEITETTLMHHSDETLRTLEQFAGMGIAVAVDDFGIGHSSLSYLKRFPVDTLKIDKSFLREVEGDGDNLAIVTAIVALGRSLQLDVLAEGVETAAQLKVLRGLGCDGAQGLYFSEPVPADQVPGLFRQYEVS